LKSFSGNGLGLYISKNIIEDHGGKIWAQNNHDLGKHGTRITSIVGSPVDSQKSLYNLTSTSNRKVYS